MFLFGFSSDLSALYLHRNGQSSHVIDHFVQKGEIAFKNFFYDTADFCIYTTQFLLNSENLHTLACLFLHNCAQQL